MANITTALPFLQLKSGNERNLRPCKQLNVQVSCEQQENALDPGERTFTVGEISLINVVRLNDSF